MSIFQKIFTFFNIKNKIWDLNKSIGHIYFIYHMRYIILTFTKINYINFCKLKIKRLKPCNIKKKKIFDTKVH